ncbi:MAG: SoxR reducing system RseC family protein [Candidatus Hydrothermia bacterium]
MSEKIKGIIVSKKSEKTYLVKILKEGGCASCTLSKFCSLGKSEDSENLIEVTGENLKVGDLVSIEERTSGIMIASFLIFIVPIIFFIVGYYVGKCIGLSEPLRTVCGFFLLSVYMLILHFLDRKLKEILFSFKIKRVL